MSMFRISMSMMSKMPPISTQISCMMFEMFQPEIQVTVGKIFWKMFPKKYTQMANMPIMIILTGEITGT